MMMVMADNVGDSNGVAAHDDKPLFSAIISFAAGWSSYLVFTSLEVYLNLLMCHFVFLIMFWVTSFVVVTYSTVCQGFAHLIVDSPRRTNWSSSPWFRTQNHHPSSAVVVWGCKKGVNQNGERIDSGEETQLSLCKLESTMTASRSKGKHRPLAWPIGTFMERERERC